MTMDEGITLRAPAKINLTLEVLGRREDGFHEIRSIFQAVDLCDTLSLKPRRAGTDFRCSQPHLEREDNSVVRAAALVREATGCRKGISIYLEKAIPEASGLGGHSSDAAACLLGLNRLWGLGLPRERLAGLAARLSSDAVFFLSPGTALVEGRGERITPLPPLTGSKAVIMVPSIPTPSKKTEALYRSLGVKDFTTGERTGAVAERLRHGQGLSPEFIFNVFEGRAFDIFSGLREYRHRFLVAGASSVHLTGSGPALFTLVGGEAEAEKIASSLKGQGLQAWQVGVM